MGAHTGNAPSGFFSGSVLVGQQKFQSTFCNDKPHTEIRRRTAVSIRSMPLQLIWVNFRFKKKAAAAAAAERRQQQRRRRRRQQQQQQRSAQLSEQQQQRERRKSRWREHWSEFFFYNSPP